MAIELKVPEVGESVTEVEIGSWLKNVGEAIRKDEPVVSLESEKATLELPAPESGVIAKVLKNKGETAKVGEVIGYLDAAGKPAASNKNADKPTKEEPPPAPSKKAASPSSVSEPRVMPAARQALAEHNLSAERVEATGPGGRMLKEDVLRAAQQK